VGSIGAELNYVVRRAFVPKLVVQIYNTSPLAAALIANSQPASGGVSSVTVPAQGAQFVNMQWVGYDGSFNQPAVQPGVTNLEFNLKGAVIPIPYLGFEGLIQDNHEIIPLLAARMNDAGNVYCDGSRPRSTTTPRTTSRSSACRARWTTARTCQLRRPVAHGQHVAEGQALRAGTVAPTRALVMQYITGTFKNCGELPSFGIMGPATWQSLANDFLPNESRTSSPRRRASMTSPGVRARPSARSWSPASRSTATRTASRAPCTC
jgi:hypothetical protein